MNEQTNDNKDQTYDCHNDTERMAGSAIGAQKINQIGDDLESVVSKLSKSGILPKFTKSYGNITVFETEADTAHTYAKHAKLAANYSRDAICAERDDRGFIDQFMEQDDEILNGFIAPKAKIFCEQLDLMETFLENIHHEIILSDPNANPEGFDTLLKTLKEASSAVKAAKKKVKGINNDEPEEIKEAA